MRNNVEYPLLAEWTTAEIIKVSEFYLQIEQANTVGVERVKLLKTYQDYLKIVPAKMVQKQIDKQFEVASGYSIYRTIQAARQGTKKMVKINWERRNLCVVASNW